MQSKQQLLVEAALRCDEAGRLLELAATLAVEGGNNAEAEGGGVEAEVQAAMPPRPLPKARPKVAIGARQRPTQPTEPPPGPHGGSGPTPPLEPPPWWVLGGHAQKSKGKGKGKGTSKGRATKGKGKSKGLATKGKGKSKGNTNATGKWGK